MPNLDSLSIRRGSLSGQNNSIAMNEYDNQIFSISDETSSNEDLHELPHSHSTTTTYIKTLQRLTREALPHINLYRDVRSIHMASRPTLDELHQETMSVTNDGKLENESKDPSSEEGVVKFGWITGVLVRCLLNIWGPIMFLRLTAIVGRAGIIQSILVVLLSATITSITGLSISAISTNGMVKGGGTYYLISRSLGAEFGGAIGVIFAFANAVAVAMHTVGFAESLRDLLHVSDLAIIDSGLNDMRIIGVITVCVLVSITMVGMEWEQKAQLFLLVILLIAIADVIVGSFLPGDDLKMAKGFEGWSSEVFEANVGPDYRGEGFFQAFSIFFPASTGILAGVNISGDLKDPSKAIPKGTLLAILLTSICYIVFCVVSGGTVWRDADGDVEHFYNGTYRDCAANFTCPYGLQNNYQVMELISAYGYLIYAGCFAATLSSALACLVSAPKIFQALCNDKIFPPLKWFGKGFGKNKEPLRSYVLAFLIAVAFILIAELNIIAPIISNFFMAAYCLINFACFHAALNKSPGFRPGFKYWNMWVSLLGAVLSSIVMFIMSWQTALLTFVLVLALYLYITYKKPAINWGSSNQAATYTNALKAAHVLVQTEDHVKNYRPQLLIFTGSPSSRPALIDFGNHIVKGIGLIVCGHVIKNHLSHKARFDETSKAYKFFSTRKIKAFYSILEEDTLSRGARSLMQATGVGKLKPNMAMLGYMNNWQTRDPQDVLEYFNTIHEAFDMQMSVGILRTEGGLDFSFFTDDDAYTKPTGNGTQDQITPETTPSSDRAMSDILETTVEIDSVSGIDVDSMPPEEGPKTRKFFFKKQKKKDKAPQAKVLPKEVVDSIDMFRTKRPKSTIDVWWLYDDGGLTLLIPYILTTRKYWQKCKLRVFTMANKDNELDQEQLNLAALLRKFRIQFSDVVVLPNVTKKPKECSLLEFNLFLKNMKCKAGDEKNSLQVTETELETMRGKTERYIKIRELLLRHSRNADLVVMTLPIPKKNKVSAALYLAWLEALTKDLPPVLLVRGNQNSVLTFYS